MATYKNDIFEIIKNIDKRNFNYFDSLSEEQIKDFAPSVVLRWISGVAEQNGIHIYYLLSANYINKNLWKISSDKKLCYQLMASIGVGKSCYHQWIKGPKIKKVTNKVLLELMTLFNINELEAKIIVKEQGLSGIMEIFKKYGYQSDEVKELIKSSKDLFDKE